MEGDRDTGPAGAGGNLHLVGHVPRDPQAVTVRSGDETGAAASLMATGTGRVDAAREGGHIAATRDPLGTSSRSDVP